MINIDAKLLGVYNHDRIIRDENYIYVFNRGRMVAAIAV